MLVSREAVGPLVDLLEQLTARVFKAGRDLFVRTGVKRGAFYSA